MRILFKIVLLSIAGLFVLVPATGFTASGIQISPVTYNFEIKPGESKSAQVIITNRNETEEVNYVMEAELFNKINEDGAPSFTQSDRQAGVTTLVDWISFSGEKEGVLKPTQDKVITFTINVPAGAEPGGHYAAVFVKAIKKNAEGKTELGVSSRVGTLVLVSIPGAVNRSGLISGFTLPKFVWRGPVNMAMRVENTGSIHYDSKAKIEFDPILGKTTKAQFKVNEATGTEEDTHTILPDSTRLYEATWNKRFPFGYYKVLASAADGDGKNMTTTAVLWAIPLEIAIPALVLIILIITIIKYLRRHLRFVPDTTSGGN